MSKKQKASLRAKQKSQEAKQKRREAEAAKALSMQQAAQRKEAEQVAVPPLSPLPPPRSLPTSPRQKKSRWLPVVIGLATAAVVFGFLVIYLANYVTLQTHMNDVLADDPRNDGIEVSVHHGRYINSGVLVYNLKSVSGSNSMIDVFRVFLQFAEEMKSREFDMVKLCFRGDERFTIDGDYFRKLGREYSWQNPVYTIRTFPEHLRTPSGVRAFTPRLGGWLYVLEKQMEDVSSFHYQWWAGDLFGGPNTRLHADDLPSLEDLADIGVQEEPSSRAESSDFEILGIESRITESNEIWWKYAWKLTLRSGSASPIALQATIKFLDQDGFIVDTDTAYDLHLRPYEERDFTGFALINADTAPNVANTEALVRRR